MREKENVTKSFPSPEYLKRTLRECATDTSNCHLARMRCYVTECSPNPEYLKRTFRECATDISN